MSLLLFVKGEKGLAANKNGRFMFPDRNSEIKEEGLYDCEITIDKDSYAFVKGKPVKTMMPSVEYMTNAVAKEVLEENRFVCVQKFVVKKVGYSTILYTLRDDIATIGYLDENNDYYAFLSYTDDRRDYNIRKLYNVNRFENVEGYDTLKKEAINNWFDELDDEMLKKVAAVAFIKAAFYPSNKVVDITSVDNKFIIISTEFYGMYSGCVFGYNKDNGIIQIENGAKSCFDKNTSRKDINITEVVNYVIENHLGTKGIGKEETYTNHISFMGSIIDVICLNGSLFIDDISDESKTEAAKSFKELEDYRRKVSKKISRSSLSELVKLSPRQVLGIKGV